MNIKQITGQHGKTVALVFNKMGLKLQPTPANVVLATTLYKDQFIDTLADAVDQETTNFGGTFSGIAQAVANATKNPAQFNEMQTLGNVTVQASYNKKTKGEKIKNTLRDVLGLVLTGYGTYKSAKANGQSQEPSLATNPYIPAPLPAEEKPKKKFNPWIIGIIAIVVLLIIVFATKKKA